jgi:uncharacterized YigZ family protein
MADSYRVLKSTFLAEIKVKGSRFIARAVPVRSLESVQLALDDIRREDRDATHHCTAYRLGPSGDEFRFNDDGEPSGTAGRPILRQIEGHDLTNTLVVVTRYFGGIKLGTGGLIRAYGDAAREALDHAPVDVIVRRKPISVKFAYADTSPAMHTISRFDAEILNTEYGDETRIELGVRYSEVSGFLEAFENALSGRCQIDIDGPR